MRPGSLCTRSCRNPRGVDGRAGVVLVPGVLSLGDSPVVSLLTGLWFLVATFLARFFLSVCVRVICIFFSFF